MRVSTYPCLRMTAYPTNTITAATARNWQLVARVGRVATARPSVRPMLYRDLRAYPVEELRKTELRFLGGAVLTLPGREDPVFVRSLFLRHDRARITRSLRVQPAVRKIRHLENQDYVAVCRRRQRVGMHRAAAAGLAVAH